MIKSIVVFFALWFALPHACFSQSDPEFPAGFIMHLSLHNGMVTTFKKAPDLYIGGVQLIPQLTIIDHLLRTGIIADGFYTGKNLQAAVGPTASVKLATIGAGNFGSAGNINLHVEHLWGSGHQHLAGGGVQADLGNLLQLGLSAHRDYHLRNWWFQSALGIRVSRRKKTPEPFNQ